jgi:hypothetical protein
MRWPMGEARLHLTGVSLDRRAALAYLRVSNFSANVQVDTNCPYLQIVTPLS